MVLLSALIFSIINAEYEYIALHRDVGETELKQVRATYCAI